MKITCSSQAKSVLIEGMPRSQKSNCVFGQARSSKAACPTQTPSPPSNHHPSVQNMFPIAAHGGESDLCNSVLWQMSPERSWAPSWYKNSIKQSTVRTVANWSWWSRSTLQNEPVLRTYSEKSNPQQSVRKQLLLPLAYSSTDSWALASHELFILSADDSQSQAEIPNLSRYPRGLGLSMVLWPLAQHDLAISTSAESYNANQELRFHFLHPNIFSLELRIDLNTRIHSLKVCWHWSQSLFFQSPAVVICQTEITMSTSNLVSNGIQTLK